MFFLQIFDASYSLDMEHMSQTIILESSTLVWILKFQNVYDYLKLQNLTKLHLLFGVITFCPTMGIRVFSERKLSYFSQKMYAIKCSTMRKLFSRRKVSCAINCAKKLVEIFAFFACKRNVKNNFFANNLKFSQNDFPFSLETLIGIVCSGKSESEQPFNWHDGPELSTFDLLGTRGHGQRRKYPIDSSQRRLLIQVERGVHFIEKFPFFPFENNQEVTLICAERNTFLMVFLLKWGK